MVWERTSNPCRLSTWLVLPPCCCSYVYGGKEWTPRKWPSILGLLRVATEDVLGLKEHFNSAVVNVYLGGEGAVGRHADDEPLFDATRRLATIASISLGEERIFEVERRADKFARHFELTSGDLVTMEGLFQADYLHGIPRSATAHGIRYNITFRRVVCHQRACPLSTRTTRPSRRYFSETPVAKPPTGDHVQGDGYPHPLRC